MPMVTETNSFLITGATGTTGSAVVLEMLSRGLPVRAFVHKTDFRSEQLRRAGAEIHQGDLLDLMAVRSALGGIRRAYFCFPPEDRLLEASVNFAVAAREANLEAVVNMSQ